MVGGSGTGSTGGIGKDLVRDRRGSGKTETGMIERGSGAEESGQAQGQDRSHLPDHHAAAHSDTVTVVPNARRSMKVHQYGMIHGGEGLLQQPPPI